MTHKPVLLKETIEMLDLKPGKVYCDLTFGGGGHSIEILQRSSPDGIVIAFDQDDEAIKRAIELKETYKDRLIPVKANFANCFSKVTELGYKEVDGALIDIGVSSFQLGEKNRGFSFAKDGPLDMRMDRSNYLSARDIVNTWSRFELENIISFYGQERFARRIAKKIEEKRKLKTIETTLELASIVTEAVPSYFYKKIHPATKTFQALRIVVNAELENLKEGLIQAIKLLKVNAKLIVITFHSLEDKIVKETFKDHASKEIVTIVNKKPIVPSLEEINANYRARSAKLRAIEKIGGLCYD